MRDKEKELKELIDQGLTEFVLHTTRSMLVLRVLELLGVTQETTEEMWSNTYELVHKNISKFSLEDIAKMLSDKGDEKNE